MKIKDIQCDETFLEDWEEVRRLYPKWARSLDNKIRMILASNRLPNSFQNHKARHTGDETLQIAYLNVGKQGWRIFFDIDCHGTLHLLRLVTHDEEKKVLRSITRA